MRTPTPQAFLVAAAALGGAGLTALFGFGPLDPPNGPITSTYKTVSEVEPRIALSAQNTPGDADSVFRITAAGSYYLTGPVAMPSGKSGIEVAFSNVTIDLNGFRLQGQNGSLDGIHVNSGYFDITIRNGSIVAARGDGIEAADIVTLVRVDRMTVSGCSGQGIVVGDYSEVSHCTVTNSGSHGINAGDTCQVSDCISASNGGVGIDVDNDCSVRNCIAKGNTTDGISTNDGCTVAGCTAATNTVNGINTEGTCVVSGSVGRANGGVGVDVDATSVVLDCAAQGNTGNGISANDGSVIATSVATANHSGIVVGAGVSVHGCTAYNSSVNGIEFGSYSYLFSNLAYSNGNGGLVTTGDGSRVDQNQCVDNTVGLFLGGKDSYISRNLLVPNQSPVYGDFDDNADLSGSGFAAWDNFAN